MKDFSLTIFTRGLHLAKFLSKWLHFLKTNNSIT